MFWYLMNTMNTMQTLSTLAPRSYLLVAMENWAKAGKPPQVAYKPQTSMWFKQSIPQVYE